mmetsp:Transcript_9036/g.18869  ORF Transcript_9036/g.18869 Transcript_9036/m.18869 type:complete len:138 (+) Transcript_9036:1065-1478(+)
MEQEVFAGVAVGIFEGGGGGWTGLFFVSSLLPLRFMLPLLPVWWFFQLPGEGRFRRRHRDTLSLTMTQARDEFLGAKSCTSSRGGGGRDNNNTLLEEKPEPGRVNGNEDLSMPLATTTCRTSMNCCYYNKNTDALYF